MEFKGTKGALELKFVVDVCIGIGTIGDFSQITANTILPDTDAEYEKEKEEILANMTLYAASKDLLEALQDLVDLKYRKDHIGKDDFYNEKQKIAWVKAKQAIEKALTIK